MTSIRSVTTQVAAAALRSDVTPTRIVRRMIVPLVSAFSLFFVGDVFASPMSWIEDEHSSHATEDPSAKVSSPETESHSVGEKRSNTATPESTVSSKLSQAQQLKREKLERVMQEAQRLSQKLKQPHSVGSTSGESSPGKPAAAPSMQTSERAAEHLVPTHQSQPKASDLHSADDGEATHGSSSHHPDEHAASEPSTAAEALRQQEIVDADSVIDGEVDRLALATSLYAETRFDECRHVIKAIDVEGLKRSDRDWLLWMSAGCLRRDGQLSEAESVYRELVRDAETEWLAESAKWWLDHLTDQQMLQTLISRINGDLQSWKEENNDLLKPTGI